jgi:hypothetical protein
MSDFTQLDDVIFWNGLFFLRLHVLKSNDPLVKETLDALYRHVSAN